VNIDDIFDSKAGEITDLQINLQEKLGEHTWKIDNKTAEIEISPADGRNFKCPIQYIGSHSELSNSWIWSHKNPSVKFPNHSLIDVLKIIEYGKRHQIEYFNENGLSLSAGLFSSISAWDIAYSVVGLTGKPAFKCDYDNGSLFVLLDKFNDDTRTITPKVAVERIIKSTHLLIYHKQKHVAIQYLKRHNIKYNIDGNQIAVDGTELRLNFSENGYLN
jgi:hypothetical protein